jgi:cytochrome P450
LPHRYILHALPLPATLFLFVSQAGQGTTTNTLSFVMHALSTHPEIIQQAYEEVVNVCGASGPITWQHVHELK